MVCWPDRLIYQKFLLKALGLSFFHFLKSLLLLLMEDQHLFLHFLEARAAQGEQEEDQRAQQTGPPGITPVKSLMPWIASTGCASTISPRLEARVTKSVLSKMNGMIQIAMD